MIAQDAPCVSWLESLNLNEQQRDAVTYLDGPLRILAGAGTGKTQTLTSRFVYLVREANVPAHQILALTFSRKAAEEMRLRVLNDLTEGHRALWIQTFHSFCYRLIGVWRREEGVRPVSVIDDAVRRQVATQVVHAIPVDRLSFYQSVAARTKLVADLLTLADRAKEHLLDPTAIEDYAAAKEGRPARLHDLAAAYRAYHEVMQAGDTRDFGDLAMEVVRRLEEDPELLARTRATFRHVLVDEFQDTNRAQFELLRLLAPPDGQLCVVGDPNQAIYAFRGGRLEYMTEFDRYYPRAKTFALTANYRSGPAILHAANQLIAHNQGHDPFELISNRPDMNAIVTVTELATVDHEAEWIARRIRALAQDADKSYRFGDIAILVRSLKTSQDAIVRALTANGIPYRLGRKDTAQYEVVQGLLAALRLVIGPASWSDATRLAVQRGASSGAFRAIEGRLGPAERDAALIGESPRLSPAEAAALQVARAVAREAEGHRTWPLPLLVYHAMRLSGHLRDDSTPETGRFLTAILTQATGLTERGTTPAEFLEQLAAGYDRDEDEAPDDPHGVHLLTVHAAKGLEWRAVFVSGLAEKLFPLPMRLDRDFDLDELADWESGGGAFDAQPEHVRAEHYLREERRLAYVALTRGRDEVHLTVPRADGKGPLAPSTFVAETGTGDVLRPRSGVGLDGPPATDADLARMLRTRRQRALAAPIDGPLASDDLAAILLAQWAALELIDGAIPVRDRLIPAPHGDDSALRFSFSQLDTYETCPRRYLYESVLGLRTDDGAVALAIGTAVHEALHRLNERWRERGCPPEDDEIADAIERAWPQAGFDFTAQRRQLLVRARAMLLRFYAHERAQQPCRRPVAVEEPLDETYGPHRVRGRVDLVLQSDDGSLEIVDFKTGRPDGESVKNPAESLQLYLYDHVWRQRDPEVTPHVAFYALRHTDDKGFVTGKHWDAGQARGLTHDEATSEPLRNRIDGLLAGILANSFAPRPSDQSCGRCRCRWLCPEG